MFDQARIVIIGGGAIGTSIAYHLAKMGESDVLLLEKGALTHGATWHAAGLVGQLRGTRNLTQMMQYSVEVCKTIEADTDQPTGFKQAGSLRIASSQERWQEIKRAATQAKSFGLNMELISAQAAKDLFPLMSTEGVVGAAFLPDDGFVDPYSLTHAYAKGAKQRGVRIKEGILVEDIIVENGRVSKVVTDQGDIACEIVVNAAGLWARQVGLMAGVELPTWVVEHQYLVTEKSDKVPDNLPTYRDPDNLFYYKPEPGAFCLGGWEKNTVPVLGTGELPFTFGQQLFDGNFDRFAAIHERASKRLPVLDELGVRDMVNGPIPITADMEPIMGPVPDVENFYVACGFTSGIAASGGAGRALAEWILEGEPWLNLWPFDLRRFGKTASGAAYLKERTVETYSHYYAMHWPAEEMKTARGARRSPLYSLLAKKGAVYGAKGSWERPNFFKRAGIEQDKLSFCREGWAETSGFEHKAIRENVALIDMSSFSKFEISGPGALKLLQRLAVSNMDQPVGKIIYTQLCNKRGGIEADVSIMRTAEDCFYLVTGSAFGVHDSHWIKQHMPKDRTVQLTEVTSAKAVINLIGPNSRRVLEKITDADVSHQDFPFMTCREIRIGLAPVLAARMTYVGELGWELHIPTEFTAHVYELLQEAGEEFKIIDAGYRAIDSLRLEKGYLAWAGDISPDYTPFEAGLGFTVSFKKGDFLGREALLAQKETGTSRNLCTFVFEGDTTVYGGEAILRNGKVVGVTTSGNFGYSIGKHIVLGYLDSADAEAKDHFEIEAFGERFEAQKISGSAYDPDRLKILG